MRRTRHRRAQASNDGHTAYDARGKIRAERPTIRSRSRMLIRTEPFSNSHGAVRPPKHELFR